RESMRNKSGASMMNATTQITEVHGVSVLDLVKEHFAATNVFALTKELPSAEEMPMVNAIMNYYTAIGAENMEVAVKARANDALPNAYLGAAVIMNGDKKLFKDYRAMTNTMIELFYTQVWHNQSVNAAAIKKALEKKGVMPEGKASAQDEKVAAFFVELLEKNKLKSIFTEYAIQYAAANKVNKLDLLMAAMLLTLSWKALTNRQIVQETAADLGNYLFLNGVIVGCAAPDYKHNEFWKKLTSLADLNLLNLDFSDSCFRILFNREPLEKELFALNAMLNLTISNGPGTVSAKGAKESVSGGNPIASCYVGWMVNTGRDHGGNGFEAIKYVNDNMGDFDPYKAASVEEMNAAMEKIALKAANEYANLKKKAKDEGDMKYFKVPCVNHPVFKGKPINYDPRETHIRELFKQRDEMNPFQEFYHILVQQLFNVGATKNVFCVNIDAVIATISLDLIWKDIKSGKMPEKDMQDIAFTLFQFARMVGCSAEIADHKSRGNPIDCRTPASQCFWVG
ncbi:MAG: citrate/2-methylcitrate synthase, partial [bacterium]